MTPSLRAVTRCARTLVVGAGIAVAVIPALPAFAAATPAPNSAGQDAGLFGSGDPTYDGVFRQSLVLLSYAAHDTAPPTGAVDWLLGQQCADGGWQAYRADPSAACTPPDPANFAGEDTNETALATMALDALKVAPNHSPRPFLATGQNSDGGFAYYPGGTSDPNSTGLVIQALVAEHESPTSAGWTKGGHTGLDYLTGLQVDCAGAAADRGGIPSPYSNGAPDLFAMLQGLPGLGQFAYPVATFGGIADDDPTMDCSTPASPSQRQPRTLASDAATGYAAGWLARHLVADGATKYAPGFSSAPNISNTAYAVLALTGAGHEKTARDAALGWLLANLPPASGDDAAPAQLALVCLAIHAATATPPATPDCETRLSRTMRAFVAPTTSPHPSPTTSTSAMPQSTVRALGTSQGPTLPLTGPAGPPIGALTGTAAALILAGIAALTLSGDAHRRRLTTVLAIGRSGTHRARFTRG